MRVLVVDDEDTVVTGVRRAIVSDGHEVDTAADGARGLEMAVRGHYDVIVLDIMLPGMNGYEVCRTARARGVRSAIILLSAKRGEWDIADGLDLGADDYLTKPFSTVELLARVRARARAQDDHQVLSVGELSFDPELRRCRRGTVEIELTGREVNLLSALFQHAGTVIPKTRLLDVAWGSSFDGDPNVVEVYIGRLRRKLDTPFGTSDIETIHGVGYRLRDRAAS